MSIRHEPTLWCDGETCIGFWHGLGSVPVKELRRDARRIGWVRVRRTVDGATTVKDLCPHCIKKETTNGPET